MSDETKIFTKNDKNGDKCASGGPESGLKLIFERGVAILVRPWRFPGQPKKFVFFSIKVGTINSGTSLDSREQFKKTGKLEVWMNNEATECWRLLFNLVDELREEAARRNRNMEISEFANVTVGQMRILKAIFAFQEKYPDGVMLKLLAEKVNLTPGAASIIVDTLVKQGVLDRRTSDVDRRAVCIGLSEEGKRIVACYGDFFTGVTGEFLAGVPREEYEIMMKLLNKFNDKILRMKEENEAQ